ncbi:MAG: cysteine desulfurase family protein [Bacilli bacterium]|jgi:cysteine desulfurase
MIYLDYSATTPVAPEVLESFNKVSRNYLGNPNSIHRLGLDSKELMHQATNQIAKLLKVKAEELIFTSGATEANNLAIKGVCAHYQNRGKHIITTELEHSSVSEVMNYLKTQGYEISYLNVLPDGTIDLKHLKQLLRLDTILVSIVYVNSETGIKQPIEDVGHILKAYPKVLFHVDGTQAVGKIKVDLNNIDLFSFSAHKIYGLPGIGCLYKQKKIELTNIIHGGQSQSKYRAGTPPLPLIVSFAKALRLSLVNLDDRYTHVLKLNQTIKKALEKYPEVVINSSSEAIPHILNISILNVKPETFMHALEKHHIYLSTQTACSKFDEPSKTLLAIYKDKKRALSSIRISLSHKTTSEEIDFFLKCFDLEYHALNFMGDLSV